MWHELKNMKIKIQTLPDFRLTTMMQSLTTRKWWMKCACAQANVASGPSVFWSVYYDAVFWYLIHVYILLVHKWAADACELTVWTSERYRVEVRERLHSELLVCLLFCMFMKHVSYIKETTQAEADR